MSGSDPSNRTIFASYKISVYAILILLMFGTWHAFYQSNQAAADLAETYQSAYFVERELYVDLHNRFMALKYLLEPYEEQMKNVEDNVDLKKCYFAIKQLDPSIDDRMLKVGLFLIFNTAPRYGLDPWLVAAIAFVESRFMHIMGDGDYGIMQINYRTWNKEMDITIHDLLDIEKNIDIACQILVRYKKRYAANYVAAYNGFGRDYAKKVEAVYQRINK